MTADGLVADEPAALDSKAIATSSTRTRESGGFTYRGGNDKALSRRGETLVANRKMLMLLVSGHYPAGSSVLDRQVFSSMLRSTLGTKRQTPTNSTHKRASFVTVRLLPLPVHPPRALSRIIRS